MPNNKTINIFISYVEVDDPLKDTLEEHLKPLQRDPNTTLNIWHRENMPLGAEWALARAKYVKQAHIVLLLISSDYIANDDVYEHEITRSVIHHNKGEALVLPLLLRDCLWQTDILKPFESLPTNGKAVVNSDWDSVDTPFQQITVAIRRAIKKFVPNEAGQLVYNPDKKTDSEIINIQTPNNNSDETLEVLYLFLPIIAIVLMLIGVGIYNSFIRVLPPVPDSITDTIGQNLGRKPHTQTIISRLQGEWIHKSSQETAFIAKLKIENNQVSTYSIKDEKEYYWGTQTLVSKANSVEIRYDQWNIFFKLEANPKNPTQEIVAIYQLKNGNDVRFGNDVLVMVKPNNNNPMADNNDSTLGPKQPIPSPKPVNPNKPAPLYIVDENAPTPTPPQPNMVDLTRIQQSPIELFIKKNKLRIPQYPNTSPN